MTPHKGVECVYTRAMLSSSEGPEAQTQTGESPRLQSLAPAESPFTRRRCYSAGVADALLTSSPSEAHQSCRWKPPFMRFRLMVHLRIQRTLDVPTLAALQGVNPTASREDSCKVHSAPMGFPTFCSLPHGVPCEHATPGWCSRRSAWNPGFAARCVPPEYSVTAHSLER